VVPCGATVTRGLTLTNDGLVPLTLVLADCETHDSAAGGASGTSATSSSAHASSGANSVVLRLPGGDELTVRPALVRLHPGQHALVQMRFHIVSAARLRFRLVINLADVAKKKTWVVRCRGAC
jgi:hypothetical protein